MRIITKEEAAKRILSPLGKGHPMRAMLLRLKPGGVLTVSREEFTWKTHTPNYICLQITKKTGTKFIVKKDKSSNGWAIEIDTGE